MAAGVLSREHVKQLVNQERIIRPSGEEWDKLIDHSAFDLPLGNEYWEMRGSCRAGATFKVRDDIIPRFAKGKTEPKELSNGTTLHPGQVYVFRADCRIKLAGTRIEGRATGKSSIGRLDVLVRLLADNSDSFDFLPADYDGNLFIEVTPITFPLVVHPGTCLSQLRLCRGRSVLSTLTMEALACEEGDFPVVDRDGGALVEFCKEHLSDIMYPFSLDLSPDPRTGFSAFKAKEFTDQEPIDPEKVSAYDPALYWESVNWDDSAIDLTLDRLYILRSRERLRIPAHLSLECKSYTETMGEWRIEYAGFGHPFFGTSRNNGAPIIFEVRGHNIPTILTDHIPLGNVHFRRMSCPAVRRDQDDLGPYEQQELQLAKCFKPWPVS